MKKITKVVMTAIMGMVFSMAIMMLPKQVMVADAATVEDVKPITIDKPSDWITKMHADEGFIYETPRITDNYGDSFWYYSFEVKETGWFILYKSGDFIRHSVVSTSPSFSSLSTVGCEGLFEGGEYRGWYLTPGKYYIRTNILTYNGGSIGIMNRGGGRFFGYLVPTTKAFTYELSHINCGLDTLKANVNIDFYSTSLYKKDDERNKVTNLTDTYEIQENGEYILKVEPTSSDWKGFPCTYEFIVKDLGQHGALVDKPTKPAKRWENGVIETVCNVCGLKQGEKEIPAIDSVQIKKTQFEYTGGFIYPAVEAVDVEGNIIAASNYSLSGLKNKAVGQATVTVKMNGVYYEGEDTFNFDIVPKKPTISKVAPGKKQLTVTVKKVTNDIKGFEFQVATNKKFTSNFKTVTTKSKKTMKATIKNLKSKKKYYVRVRAYKVVNGRTFVSAWTKVKSAKTK